MKVTRSPDSVLSDIVVSARSQQVATRTANRLCSSVGPLKVVDLSQDAAGWTLRGRCQTVELWGPLGPDDAVTSHLL
ncbi:MAG: hypothetical protein K0V04_44500 [Deltaproteobacteria bacterium]|nr:hypothetical protein [Deltaproteobacteria bacterium]